ncbi:hypothetical protein QYM36_016745, partial [Artemia franciscana]
SITTVKLEFIPFFRCVKKEDKSVALGMGNFLTSLFGFIPGPIIYGALIGIFLLGTSCDLVLCWFVKDLDFYSEKENKDKKNGNPSDDD